MDHTSASKQSASSPQQARVDTILSGDLVYYERLPMLEVIFDRLVRISTSSMRNFTADNVEVKLQSITSIRFGDYLNTITEASLITIFLAEEWDNHGVIVIDHHLIYTMIDVLMGGRREHYKESDPNRHYTTIEMNLVERMLQVILADLSAAFDPLCPVTFRYERTETNPNFALIARPANAAVRAKFSFIIDQKEGGIEIVIPYATLEPIRELLLQNFMGEKFGRDSIWENHLAYQLYRTDLEISAILDELTLPLSTVLSWKKGSHLYLEATPDSPVKLVCGDHGLFLGQLGNKSGNVAVKITDFVENEEDLEDVNNY